jgi:hypothetical protein
MQPHKAVEVVASLDCVVGENLLWHRDTGEVFHFAPGFGFYDGIS